MDSYETLNLSLDDLVLTVKMKPQTDDTNIHWDLANLLERVRPDDEVRVLVLTGAGGDFLTARPREHYSKAETLQGRVRPRELWHTFTGILRIHEALVSLEKPVIAKVNGAVSGLGASLVFGADLIVAREDVTIVDSHMGAGEVEGYGAEFSVVPGDGGTVLIPMFLPPALAKEALFLARSFTARELAALGVINYAVPADELDELVDSLARRLKKRSPYILGWTKRAANRAIAAQVASALDSGIGYEMVSFFLKHRGD
ncbi:MAG: enoyl-CoA hydratase/isomerase family protein [Proteobacteria bacterium]|nr:enoyl-CoA hydratase/isomerase family protein [Pseudomonadota bacterium]